MFTQISLTGSSSNEDGIVPGQRNGMHNFGWQRNSSVRDWLFAEGYRFEFFQALRLLEQIASTEAIPNGLSRNRSLVMQGTPDLFAAIRLRSQISFIFPASEVNAVRLTSAKPFSAELITPLMSLGGARGPLPDSLSELVLERLKQRDGGLREFLDIFHHRFLTLLYYSQKRNRLWLGSTKPEDSKFASYLFSFAGVGIGSKELRARASLPDRMLLAYAGLLWQQPRSAAGLQRIVADYLGSRAQIHQLHGSWSLIEPEDQTRIGRSGANQVLGSTATIGKRFWNAQAGFTIDIGSLDFKRFESFLPGSGNFEGLCSLTRFYVGDHLRFQFRLKLKASEVPPLRLGSNRLGWTTWLGTKPSRKDKTIRVKPA
jgi:type VI secretion system protein ImpH